ncbi:reverse transcriptase family protein [Nitrincola alkalilacustris]|uniref:reverse transcriptase family protein n=1 Tax=Nitrincola alkalilacustris TaxID=1571224 RepID=UPI00124DC848|nr:reverse transcriptase family protein [Nitrincola alkalilacustris]
MNQPRYPFAPIGDLEKLSLALGVKLLELYDLKARSNELFFQTRDIVKPDGSHRITYDVRAPLKLVHGKICEVFLRRVEYPEYLQGSIKKRDYLTDANKHVRSKVLISEDITNFFPCISKKVIHEVWVGVFGFSNEVSDFLAELVTLDGFVVQGSKTSSYLCNLVLWSREAQLVKRLKMKGLVYTRYVDDITVSSKRILNNKEKSDIINSIYAMFRSVGAKPNRRKHKIMPRSAQQEVHGVNVNRQQATMPKYKRNQIRAAVHECEIIFDSDSSSETYISTFNSAMGRVNTLGRMHKVEAEKLKVRLEAVKPILV